MDPSRYDGIGRAKTSDLKLFFGHEEIIIDMYDIPP